jgi:hypothetical protein
LIPLLPRWGSIPRQCSPPTAYATRRSTSIRPSSWWTRHSCGSRATFGGTTGRLAAYFAPDLARDALVLDGSLWVVGRTQAWDFPTSEGPAVFPGTWNAFLAEIDDDGGLGRALLLGEGTARAIAGDEGGCGSRARSGCSASTPRSTRRGR